MDCGASLTLLDRDAVAGEPLRVGFNRPHVVIVLPGLGAGGTEHVVNVLANQWAARGWHVTLVTFEAPGPPPYYHFDPAVRIERLGLPQMKRSRLGAIGASARRIFLLRRTLKKLAPDVVLSFLTRTNVMSLAASRGLGLDVVVSERNNPALQDVGPVWRFLRAKLYPSAFGLVTMTTGALNYFSPAMRRRSWVIPNPVDLPATGKPRRNGAVLVAVGRLVPQKGFDLLLKAFANIRRDFPEWKLVIWGEGPDRAELEAERDRLGLQGCVEMPGVTSRPGIWVETADAFVLSSRYEGWGIVLLEAMAAGLPVISFDCQWGPREMVDNEKDGLLVENGSVDALAQGLRRLLGDEPLRKKLGAAAAASAARFTPEYVMQNWDQVIHAVLAARGNEELSPC
ncbi:glycosyltransferase family 4 protein [Mesorhizobium sp. B283B1A]|uniref:glycosyltransferase family 4 protein n=1 Tax=Mesorhizobium TaxID=68287 RepID=UPI001CD050C4|nr:MULTISPECIES: glycosyltransferase family 4 protein [Mesorhizobium]MCA0049703.1 glycosyltransferase family 4 protein [Mesorhizobium sp. B283B1A]UQS67978.1 glycosyltransferase family 4 protein [Mesorhizobium opportunistum]